MASNTAQVERIRAKKRTKAGLQRKNKIRLYGTTKTLLPLDKPNANEKAQLAAQAKRA